MKKNLNKIYTPVVGNIIKFFLKTERTIFIQQIYLKCILSHAARSYQTSTYNIRANLQKNIPSSKYKQLIHLFLCKADTPGLPKSNDRAGKLSALGALSLHAFLFSPFLFILFYPIR